MSQTYTLYSFVSDGSQTTDLSRFFLTPGIAERYRNNSAWQLFSAGNPSDPSWASGGVNPDGSLGPATVYQSEWNNDTFSFHDDTGYPFEMQLQIVFEPEASRQCSSCDCPDRSMSTAPVGARSSNAQTVELFTGRFVHSIPLLSISGVGANSWQFGVTYYSNFGWNGILGKNFGYPQASYLNQLGERPAEGFDFSPLIRDVELVSLGNVRVIFEAVYHDDVEVPYVTYSSVDNNSAATLARSGAGTTDMFTLTAFDGVVTTFSGFDPEVDTPGQMTSITDRFGNKQTFIWQSSGGIPQLTSATDSYGREIRYTYYGSEAGFCLQQVEDYLGRTIRCQYDSFGHLIAIINTPIKSGAGQHV